jgi:hypothetical protein
MKKSEFFAKYDILKRQETRDIEEVMSDAQNLRFIRHPTEAVCLAAVNKDGSVIQRILNPSEAVKLAAVKQNGFAIQFIENPSEEVMAAALEQNFECLAMFKPEWFDPEA